LYNKLSDCFEEEAEGTEEAADDDAYDEID
jgi:hypothetical protein